MNELNKIIANNLSTLRKKSELTQLQLAEKLNYSDKAVSKWEKGDCVPNVYVIMTLAEFYGVKVQDIVYENKSVAPRKNRKNFRLIISGLSSMLVWFLATVAYVLFTYISGAGREWLAFIIAIPVFFLVLTILSAVWRWKVASAVFSSLFIWTLITTICLILQEYKLWLVYIVGVPLQAIIILSVVLSYLKHKVKE